MRILIPILAILLAACGSSKRSNDTNGPYLQIVRIADSVQKSEEVKWEILIGNDSIVDYRVNPKLTLSGSQFGKKTTIKLPFKRKRGFFSHRPGKAGQYDVELEMVCKLKNGNTQKLSLKDKYVVLDK